MSIVSRVLAHFLPPNIWVLEIHIVALCSRSNFISFPILYKCNSYSTSGHSKPLVT